MYTWYWCPLEFSLPPIAGLGMNCLWKDFVGRTFLQRKTNPHLEFNEEEKHLARFISRRIYFPECFTTTSSVAWPHWPGLSFKKSTVCQTSSGAGVARTTTSPLGEFLMTWLLVSLSSSPTMTCYSFSSSTTTSSSSSSVMISHSTSSSCTVTCHFGFGFYNHLSLFVYFSDFESAASIQCTTTRKRANT